jgi:hypothetical protein
MPLAVHAICPACALPTHGAEVIPDERLLACDLCGARSRFDLLPPLLFLTGASGAGKTTLLQELAGRVPEAVLIDQDVLWSMNPAHDDPASDYRLFRGLVLHLAERIARNRVPVLVEGTCTPDQYEDLGERWYFSKTAYLALVSTEQELRRRLAARPGWRRSAQQVEPMVALNERFRAKAGFDPPVEVLDTTGRSVSECAAAAHDWIRAQILSG